MLANYRELHYEGDDELGWPNGDGGVVPEQVPDPNPEPKPGSQPPTLRSRFEKFN